MAQSHNRDWEDLGDTIQDIIDRAVRSQNYQELNETITKAVGQAIDLGSDAVKKVIDPRLHPVQNSTPGPNRNMYSSKLGSMSARRDTPQPPKKNLPVLYSNPSGKQALAIAKTVGGSLLACGSGATLMASAVLNAVITGGSFLTASTFFLLAGLAGGTYLLGDGIHTIGKTNRFKAYVQALGHKTYCNLEQLAAAVGKSKRFVKKELRGMIHDGLFLQGHLDQEETCLITSHETYQHYQQSQLRLAEQQREAAIAAEAAKVNPQLQSVLDRGNSFLRQIRSCNDAIPGEEISEKISRIESIVAQIFQQAQQHPEIVPELNRLMDYYLPMTVKLLNAYAEMDRQPVQGQNILSSKLEIENTLDTLNTAFERLLDDLFRHTAMDVASDISVLNTLLAQEGLADDELSRMRKENESKTGE